jgi:hypothetical protein
MIWLLKLKLKWPVTTHWLPRTRTCDNKHLKINRCYMKKEWQPTCHWTIEPVLFIVLKWKIETIWKNVNYFFAYVKAEHMFWATHKQGFLHWVDSKDNCRSIHFKLFKKLYKNESGFQLLRFEVFQIYYFCKILYLLSIFM